MDMEKVKKGLQAHAEGCGHRSNYCDFMQCPYRIDDESCDIEQMCIDALALLKEQETELSFREPKAITHTATKLDDATCPSCGNVVGEKIKTGAIWQSVVQVQWNYCHFCGQKLDWKGR